MGFTIIRHHIFPLEWGIEPSANFSEEEQEAIAELKIEVEFDEHRIIYKTREDAEVVVSELRVKLRVKHQVPPILRVVELA